jgi:phosphatidate cytidylyltransferase
MTSHLKRWMTAIIAVPVLFSVVYFGSEALFCALIIVIILMGVHEYHAMVFGAEQFREKAQGMAIGLLIPLTVYFGNLQLLLAMLSFSVLFVFFTYLLRIKEDRFDIWPVGKLVLGFMYVPLMMSYFILIRRMDQGVLWIFFLLVLAFSGDVTAYYVGKNFGRKKLLPHVSPNKTVEGTIGLMIGSTVGCVIFKTIFFPALPIVHAAAMGFFGGILGQLGDLCESALKRSSGVKDSGVILPGHGGILDRLDCLIFIAPFVYYYHIFLIK